MTKTSSVVAAAEFQGRVIMIGSGGIGRAVLPLLKRHLPVRPGRLTVLSADARGREAARAERARFIHRRLEPGGFRGVLDPLVAENDLVINLSVGVSSLDLIRFCAERGSLYVDTSLEPWEGELDDPGLDPRQRTNFLMREQALELGRELGPDAPTAVIDHGANPGLVSHFVKRALLHLNRAREAGGGNPNGREGWARLARDLGVSVIQISERDTQAADVPRRSDEFVNTWSVEAFVDELLQPAELSLGTAEQRLPDHARRHGRGGGALYLTRPGGGTFARSWTPAGSVFQGMLVSHDEVFSIADHLSLRRDGGYAYRPTVMYVYRPCDQALLSALELEGRGWNPQPGRRRLDREIVSGMDELGVLLAGRAGDAYWYGSQLSIEEARRHVPSANATCVQVAAGALAAAVWAVAHPRRGLVEPDDMDFRECLAVAEPYLGTMRGAYTEWTPLLDCGGLFRKELDPDNHRKLKKAQARRRATVPS